MNYPWNMIIWEQFGAAIDMLEDAIQLCPAEHWKDVVWEDTEAAEYGQFWFVAYHTLVWLNVYNNAMQRKDYVPPEPFINGKLPDAPYSKDEIQAYLNQSREGCRAALEAMDEAKAAEIYVFSWGVEMSYGELQLYTMRHVQEHASQLSLHVGRIGAGAELDWVSRAGQNY